MKYPRLSRFTFQASRLTSRYQCRSERKTYKTVVPRFRKRLYLSGSIGDTTASGFSRLFVFLFSRFLVFAVTSILLIAQPVSAQVVEIPDPNLENAIRATLNIPDNNPITQQEMLQLTELIAWQLNITNLTGLQYATNLENLPLWGNQIQDVTPLANLTKLRNLDLAYNTVESVQPIAGLINLQRLNLTINRVQDITPLANLVHLQKLYIRDNLVTDITPLANLTDLTELTVSQNQVRDLNPLTGLTRLTLLHLSDNRISDLTPLMNLTALETLRLNMNAIVDITPLIGLKNLTELWIAENPIRDFSPLAQLVGVELDLDIDLSRLDQLNLVVTIPDPNLERAIRETLALPDGVPLTQLEMLRLTELFPWQRDITDLTGLQYATNLELLALWGNQITDLSPLANLTKLRELNLAYNAVESVEPIAGLINLQRLNLTINRVQDITPLANLINLKWLYIRANLVTDITPLQGLNLIEFQYDQVCDIPPILPPVRERIENWNLPSIIRVFDPEFLFNDESNERGAFYDLNLSADFRMGWNQTPMEPTEGLATTLAGDLDYARGILQFRTAQNPNMIFLLTVSWRAYFTDEILPPGSDFWLRDENGEIIRSLAGSPQLNFLKPEVQDLIANRIVAVERCGLFDGVMLDQFANHGAFGWHLYRATEEDIIQAILNIFRSVREQTRDDFLILINANRTKATRYTEYVNGAVMELGYDSIDGYVQDRYTHDGLKGIESTLSWNEENFRSPRLNSVEGWGIPTEPPDSQDNLRQMRMITTLSLTHSNGCVMHNTGKSNHDHIWHSFWDADLGRPTGPKAQRYQHIDGLFIREFTNGWAVYNRSGEEQTITLPRSSIGVSSNKQDITHLLPDLDGEIYLRVGKPFDLNADGIVNVLDLILISQSFGTPQGDINGDGTTNILDLTLVVQQFRQ